jgi:hypothetical protein
MSEHSEDLAVVIDDFGVALNWSELHDRRSSHSSTNRATAGWPHSFPRLRAGERTPCGGLPDHAAARS